MPTSDRSGAKVQVDYREVLSPEDFAVFADLRELRKTIATRTGVPIYTIFNNQQLADMVTRRAVTKEDFRNNFRNIDGVGSSRIDKYGDAFVERLIAHFNGTHETSQQSVPKNS